ncbi:MAG: hypothetical protein IJH12_00105 [Clostridia bacterium]|nr:hypothetical protein [Clostridia bacterium]
MELLENIFAQLPSKKFGDDTTIYFDKTGKNVLFIVQNGTYTYLVETGEGEDKKYIMKTELVPGLCAECVVDPKRFWVIPNIDEMDMCESMGFFDIKSEVACVMCDKVFEVVSYTILETPAFRGSLFSNSTISVLATNPQGKAYAIPFLVDEGVRGCDGNPCGSVIGEAYRFNTLGRVVDDLIIEL